MFRVTFLVHDPAERQRLATELRALTVGGDTPIVSAFANAKTVEVFLDIAESAVASDVVDQFAHSLGIHAYEITNTASLATPTVGAGATDRRHLRRAVITQVRVHPDGRTLSVQARHRPYERVDHVEVEQSDAAVAIRAMVGSPDGDDRDRYVSLTVVFTWVDTVLDRPVGDREIIRDDPERRASRSLPTRDEVRPERPVDSIQSIESDPDTNTDTDHADWTAWRPYLI